MVSIYKCSVPLGDSRKGLTGQRGGLASSSDIVSARVLSGAAGYEMKNKRQMPGKKTAGRGGGEGGLQRVFGFFAVTGRNFTK